MFHQADLAILQIYQLLLNNFYRFIRIPSFLQSHLNVMLNHKSMQVRCSMDEPIQLLVDKLASKSSDLYIFWQNYNQLYHAFNQKVTEIQRLQLQNETLRKEKTTLRSASPPPEESFFKERFLYMQKSCEDFKQEMQKLRGQNRQLKKDNQKCHEDNFQLQNLLQQLRQQNSLQRSHIEKILTQLKNAQNQVNAMTKVYEELGQKEMIVSKYVERERELMGRIDQLESEIDSQKEQQRMIKARYEKIMKESMVSAKNKVIQTLPGTLQANKYKVQIISS